ncbi:RBR-type E3 ubiquitin transferase [Sarracenia purpurea var. burkii]
MAISRIEGCNKMVCNNCGQYFCYRSNQAIDGYDHFRDAACELFLQEVIQNWEERMNARQVLGQIQAQLFADRGHLCPTCGQVNAKGIDQLRPSLLQVQKPNLQTQNQFLLASQQQQVLAQAQAQGNIGNSPNFGFCGLPRGGIGAKDGQSMRNDGSVCSPVQSNPPKVKSIFFGLLKIFWQASIVMHSYMHM